MSGELIVKKVLDQRRVKEADLRRAIYVRPGGIGLHYVRLLNGNVVILVNSAVGSQTFAPNELILVGSESGSTKFSILGQAPPGSQGTSAFPPGTFFGFTADSILITAAWPETVPRGETVDVDVFGFGFRSAEDEWAIVVLPFAPTVDAVELDPAATVLSWVDLSAEDIDEAGYILAPGQVGMRLTIEVSPDAVPGRGLSFRVQRAGAVNVAADLVRIAIPVAPPVPDRYAMILSDFTDPPHWLNVRYLGGVPEVGLVAEGPSPIPLNDVPPAATALREGGALGPESFCWRSGGPPSESDPILLSLDSATGDVFSWSPSAGFDLTPAVLALSGRLMWLEWESGSHEPDPPEDPPAPVVSTIRIWSALTDFTDPVEEATFDLEDPGSEGHAVICPRITELHLYFGWSRVGEATLYTDYLYPLAGGALVDRTEDWDAGHDGIGVGSNPEPDLVGSYGVIVVEDQGCSYLLGTTIWFQPLDQSAPVLAWPINEAWPPVAGSLDYLPGVGVLAYGSGVAVRGALIAAENETPLELVAVEQWVDVENEISFFPAAYFYRSP